jgi:hypothetical protein
MWRLQGEFSAERQTAYAEAVVRLCFPSPAIVALLLALLVSQAASSVCAVQCAQHPAMTHCHAMSHGDTAAAKNCPSGGICSVDLLVSRQQETAGPTGIHVEFRSDVFLSRLASASFTQTLLSSVSPPPLVTALRI